MKLVKELFGACKPYDYLFRNSVPKSIYEQYVESCSSLPSRDIKVIFDDKVEIELESNISSKVLAIGLLEMISPAYISRLYGCVLKRILDSIKTNTEPKLFSGIGLTGENLNKIIVEVINEYRG